MKDSHEKATDKEPTKAERPPNVKTVSEFAALSDADKDKFRRNGGTVCEDGAV